MFVCSLCFFFFYSSLLCIYVKQICKYGKIRTQVTNANINARLLTFAYTSASLRMGQIKTHMQHNWTWIFLGKHPHDNKHAKERGKRVYAQRYAYLI